MADSAGAGRPEFALEAVDVPAASSTQVHADGEVVVYAVPVSRPRSGAKRKLSEDGCDSGAAAANLVGSSEAATDCVSYVVETREQRGKFLVERAVELGVPKGKLFGQLHHGKDVTLPDGRVVRSADCVSPAVPPSGCAIVACPSTSYIAQLVASKGFARYQCAEEDVKPPVVQLQVVYHLGDEQVLASPVYKAWMRRFGRDVEHVTLNHTRCPQKTVYRASAKLQAQLNSLFPSAFPSNVEYENRDGERVNADTPRRLSAGEASYESTDKALVLGESMLRYTLTPQNRRGFDAMQCWKPLDFEEIAASTSSLQDQASESQQDRAENGKDVGIRGRITFLGTGCAIPSKYRNVTGMYLELARPGSNDSENDFVGMMLDCGEGSLGQLYRYAGGDRARLQQLVDRLKFIWISHNHADHHLGVLRMLSYRSCDEDGVEPLLIIGPSQVEHWLREYARLDPIVAGKYTFVDSHCFNDAYADYQEARASAKSTRMWLQETLGIESLECVPVKHAHLSYALVATFVGGAKIAFSGDCRPSDAFARKARGALLMVHEATFEESMDTEAKQKAHSTTTEAIDVGRKAHAKHVVLTHFSQRYPKMPVMTAAVATDHGEEETCDVLTAIDLLSLDLRELHQPALSDICSQLMSKDDEEDGEVAAVDT